MIWLDVDTALGEVPVNVAPLIDDTDFKTREESVTYDQAGMDLVWNFVTTAGAYTQTAVTPTTAGDYDWANQGNGMYSIEIPASGGGSINNDTEGHGWFTGFATGILPWCGPVIGFRAVAINNALIDAAFDSVRGFGSPTALPNAAADANNGLVTGDGSVTFTAGVGNRLAVDVEALSGTVQSATDLKDFADAGYDPGTNKVQGVVLVDTTTTNTDMLTVGDIADQVWDEPIAGHNAKNTTGNFLRNASGGTQVTIRSGTAQAGSATTITLDAGASAIDDVYNGNMITTTGGTGVGQTRKLVNYVGSTKVGTIDKDWTTNPDNTTTFDVTAFAGSIISDEGVAQAGGASTITHAATASPHDDIYNGSFVTLTGGTGSGQTKTITDYDGGTQISTVDSPWAVEPDSTSIYAVTPAGADVSDSGGSLVAPTALENAAEWAIQSQADPTIYHVNIEAISGDEAAADNLESACDNYSVTRGLTGTAVPAVAADGVGGLPISDAGGLDLDTLLGTLTTLAAETRSANVLDQLKTIIAVIESQRDAHTHQPSTGSILFVDQTNGTTHAGGGDGGISNPYATFDDAQTNAGTDFGHDLYIMVAGAAAATTTHSEDATISNGYSLVRGPGRDLTWKPTANNTVAISITGDGAEVSGFQVDDFNGTGAQHGIKITDADFARVHNVWFNQTRGDGVNILRGTNCIVCFCNFDGTGAEANGQGVHVVGTAGISDGTKICNNHFADTGGDSILIENGTTNDSAIHHNEIHNSTAWGINIGASSNDALVHHNTLGNNASGNINDDGTDTVTQNNYDVVDGVWDEPLTASTHNVPTSSGKRLRDLSGIVSYSGTAVSATANTITLDTDASSADGSYDPSQVRIDEGTGAGQIRGILEYFGTGANGNPDKTGILDRDWKVPPDGTSKLVILASDGRLSTNEGQITTGGTTSATLNSLAPSNGELVNQTIQFLSGTGQDQTRLIDTHVGQAITFEALDVAVDATTGYQILPVGKSHVVSSGDKTGYALSSTGLDLVTAWTTDITGNITGNLSGSVGSVTGAVGSVTAAVVTDAASRTASKADVSALGTLAGQSAIITQGNAAWATATSVTVSDKTGFSLVSTGLDAVLVDGKDLPNALEIIAAVVAGKISNAGETTETFVGIDGSTTRVTANIDSSGNRTNITYV